MSRRSRILVQPVVMAGGSGTRLWPLSRAGFPKQFLVLTADGLSLFQQAIRRLVALEDDGKLALAPPLSVGNDEHRFLMLEQLREGGSDPGRLLLEPAGRNTAPALTLAALAARQSGADPVLVVTPADHVIPDQVAFSSALHQAVESAAEGAIVLLGVRPTRAETGYGYLRVDRSAAAPQSVRQFVEKPDAATAERYLADGSYFWNSGMFVLRASSWLKALDAFRPDIAGATRAAFDGCKSDDRFVRPDRELFMKVPSESIDFAVMERCPGSDFSIRMVPLDAGWDDLGAWDAVWHVAAKDQAGNAQLGDAIVHGCRDTLVHATSRLVSVLGLDSVVVVETPDAVLVSDRTRSQEVKQIVAELQASGRAEKDWHRKVHRPWGWYDSIDAGSRFQVKRIMVKPGASLSLQMHHHRAEHWVVVSGTADVVNGDAVMRLSENQSTYIPPGAVGVVSGRGRHRAFRGFVRPNLTRTQDADVQTRPVFRPRKAIRVGIDSTSRPQRVSRVRTRVNTGQPAALDTFFHATQSAAQCPSADGGGTSRQERSLESAGTGGAAVGRARRDSAFD
jgi:mannose-1-phosphate guanylyltransferase / mannose-6-phosphate isomerase